ncbi:MAG TPA: hypothetical protein P5133_11330, partial [Spirochaetia bacterium]|nr:hypothetical protein [Spirochaetia bacterium]
TQILEGHRNTLKATVDIEATTLGARVKDLKTREEKIAAIVNTKAPAAKVPASKASASRAPAAASKAAPPEEDLSMYGQRIVSACLAPDGRAAIIESYPAGWAMTAEELEGLLFAGELP